MNVQRRAEQLIGNIKEEINRTALIDLLDDSKSLIEELMNIIDEKDGIIDELKENIGALEHPLREERDRE